MNEALLVIDVQNAVMENAYQKEEVINRISSLIRNARLNDVPVIYVQHEYPAGPMKRGEPGWELHSLLEKPLETEPIINKTLLNSFANTNLKEALHKLGTEHLYICGAQTDYCVDSSCRGAFDVQYDVTLITDAHTTMDNDHLTAKQIIDHTHNTLGNFWSPDSTISLQNSEDVFWMKEKIK